MKAFFFVSALLLITFSALQAQDEPRPVRWMFETSMGAGFQISNFKPGVITNSFILYRNPTFQWDHAATRFFNPHVGLEVELSIGAPGENNYPQIFQNDLDQRYGPKYYISNNTIFPVSSPIVRLSAGFVYKVEKGKFLFIARPLIGFTAFDTDAYEIGLKEKHTNNLSTVSWRAGSGTQFITTFRPAVTIAYKITNRFYLTFNAKYSVFKSNFDYTETTKNYVDEKTSVIKYPYRATIQDISFTVGGIVKINRRKSQ